MKSYSNLTVSKLFGTWQKQHPEMEDALSEGLYIINGKKVAIK